MTRCPNCLVVVSNRLPVVVDRDESGWRIRRGSGGLVTAMAPILRDRGGIWIGWSGTTAEGDLSGALEEAGRRSGYDLRAIPLTPSEERNFYLGFSNEIIWPLFHDLLDRCNMDPAYWETYQTVNRKFAGAILEHTRDGDTIWVHDYHLMSAAQEVRSVRASRRLAFFLHIPFPCPDIFQKLPWREQVLRDLLHYDLIGFQTQRDRINFVQCLRTLLGDVTIRGKGRVIAAEHEGHQTRMGVFPISIDYRYFSQRAGTGEVADIAWRIHENIPERQIILGVDRLDYTKGIPLRLEAFRNALIRYPDLHGKVTLIQVVVPSREDIPEYQALKIEIESLVGEINGRFTVSGWVPIHYVFRGLDTAELLAYYRTAEIAVITPLRDGMNLVAKEYCASSLEETGVLILSEFAGAAAQLRHGAILVNPFDVNAVGDAIHDAFVMPHEERRKRMRKLRRGIRKHDIFWWVDSFLRAAVARDLDDYPPVEPGF
ncbi:MAG: trehalose-6-phosphate synthase [Candidatus Eisenbacteria bacterium]|nr:trehalose-6-phosphate synthase [Candidatus Eisenbacteria bacterium]